MSKSWWDIGRTGFAAAQLAAVEAGGEAHALGVALYGPMEHQLPVQRRVARAELVGVREALVHCLPPIRLHVDRADVLKGVARGRAWCVHSNRPHADVWRQIWDKLADIGMGEDGAQVCKIKAHLSSATKEGLKSAQRVHVRSE